MFKELDKEKVSVVNEKIYNYWDKHDILNKSNQGKEKDFVFYDGPATANGMPGIHHMMAKLLKDSVCKYYSMNGYKVDRRVGWDTHGLPVEVAVEKALGFTGKGDIEKYGIEEFNKKCKDSVLKNEEAFVDFTHKMGQLIDTKNSYITYDNSFIETEWWILKEYYKAGLIYEGFKILPYCPRCGTGLASHEVAQGYKNVSVNSVYIPFKLKDEDSYFLVWTTTPWTLIANVALCVNPEETYVKVESKGYKFILAEKLVEKVIGTEYKVIEKYSGKDLEYKEYEQLKFFESVNQLEIFDKRISRIPLNQIIIKQEIMNLEKEVKNIREEISKITKNNNTIGSHIFEVIIKYATELEIGDKDSISPTYLFTSNLKELSGAILHKTVFAFKLGYISAIKKKLNIKLPILLDSPTGKEVDQENIKLMMNILKRDFSDHQIIIASIFKYDFNNINTIEIKNRLIEML